MCLHVFFVSYFTSIFTKVFFPFFTSSSSPLRKSKISFTFTFFSFCISIPPCSISLLASLLDFIMERLANKMYLTTQVYSFRRHVFRTYMLIFKQVSCSFLCFNSFFFTMNQFCYFKCYAL